MYPMASVSTRTESPARKFTIPWNSDSHLMMSETGPRTPADFSTSTVLESSTSLRGITEKLLAFRDFAAFISWVMDFRSWTTKDPIHLPITAFTAFEYCWGYFTSCPRRPT